NDPSVDLERFMLATVLERLDEDVAAQRRGEDREPGDCGAGDKVGEVAFENAVAAAHGGGRNMAKRSFEDKDVRRSQVQLGNEGNLGTRRIGNEREREAS